jgi:hypothetical protein
MLFQSPCHDCEKTRSINRLQNLENAVSILRSDLREQELPTRSSLAPADQELEIDVQPQTRDKHRPTVAVVAGMIYML